MSDLRNLVTATSQLQQQLQQAVRHLQNQSGSGHVGGNPCPPSTSRQAFPAANRSTPIPASQPTPSAQQGLPVANPTQHQASLSSLFSWNPTSLIGRKRKAIGSVRKSQKKRLPTWSHTFVCLASTTQESLPDGQERAALQIAGLGEKRISLNALADAQEIYQDLAFHFPKLCDGGGFELLRLPEGGGKQLDVMASPESGYTVSYLRAVVHHAKIFIRPMQRDLSLEPQKDEVIIDPPKEACLCCGEMVTVTSLREHMVACKRRKASERSSLRDSSDSSILADPPADPLVDPPHDPWDGPPDDADSLSIDLYDPVNPRVNSPISIDSPISVVELGADDQDPVLEVAIHLSKEQKQPSSADEPKTIAEVVTDLQTKVTNKCPSFDMVVRRSNILSDALRRMERLSFDPEKELNVIFIGENGKDTGGLTREFFRLLSYSISSKYMYSTGCFRHNAIAYQEGVYSRLGMLAAMSLIHGGGAFRLFGPTVFNFLCGMNPADLIAGISEVPDPSLREILKQIQSTTDVADLREIVTNQIDLLIECGFNKPLTKIELSDKVNIIQTVTLHKVILGSLAELSQFRDGLASLGVLDAIRKYSHLICSYYCCDCDDKLSSDTIRNIFTEIKFSDNGTNAHLSEETAYMFFIDYLDDCEKVDETTTNQVVVEEGEDDVVVSGPETENKVSLKTVLVFFTGADSIPPLGYKSAILHFNPNNHYPTASTCAIQLTLPTKYQSYQEFKKQMDVAFCMHGGFGLM